MTARTAPLTMTQEQWVRYDYARRESNQALPEGALSPDAVALWDELAATRAQLAAVTLERNEAATSSNHLRLVLAQSLTAWEPKHNHAGGTDDCMVCVARGALDATKHFDFAISPTQPTEDKS